MPTKTSEFNGRLYYPGGLSIYVAQQKSGWLAQLQGELALDVKGGSPQPWFYGETALEAVRWCSDYHGLDKTRRLTGSRARGRDPRKNTGNPARRSGKRR